MRKLSLDLHSLAVESFATSPAARGRGTVAAHGLIGDTGGGVYIDPTLPSGYDTIDGGNTCDMKYTCGDCAYNESLYMTNCAEEELRLSDECVHEVG